MSTWKQETKIYKTFLKCVIYAIYYKSRLWTKQLLCNLVECRRISEELLHNSRNTEYLKAQLRKNKSETPHKPF